MIRDAMATIEEEFNRLKPALIKLSDFILLGKKLVVKGSDNFVSRGPNIIVGNHIGTFKDGAAFLKIISRPVFPISNKMIFNKDEFNYLIKKHLKRHLKNLGPCLDLILSPIKAVFINFISSNISKIGAIPVDMYQKKRMAIEKCQEYLKAGRAIVILQGRGRVMNDEPHPYVSTFRRGASIISYNLFKEGILVPVTPIATFGTHLPFLVPGKIKINIGEPMFISDYLADGFTETVNRFREAMEKRVKSLFLEILKAEN